MARPSTIKFLALGALAAGSVLMLATFLVDGAWGAPLFAAAAVIYPPALMALGAVRGPEASKERAPGGVALVLAALTLLLGAAWIGMFHFRGRVPDGPWWLGLPAATTIQIFGLFLLPLGVTSLGYALTFDRHGLSAEDLDGLRRRFPKKLEPDAGSDDPESRP